MRAIFRVILLLIFPSLLVVGAKAQEVKTAVTLICSTAEQAKEFVTTHRDLGRALSSINEAEGGSQACTIAPIAYLDGKQSERIERHDGTYVVTEILLVGIATPFGLRAVEPSILYTVAKVDEEAA